MKRKISPREFELLSAYLDGQLTPKERRHLESRLHLDVELSETLEQLRRTRAVLRNLPKLRAPRNFTIHPQAVRSRSTTLLSFNLMRSVSVVSTLLLILVFVSDFLQTRQFTPSMAVQKLEQTPTATLVPEAEVESPITPMVVAPLQVTTETAEEAMPSRTITETIIGAKTIPMETEEQPNQLLAQLPEATTTPSEIVQYTVEATQTYSLPEMLPTETPPTTETPIVETTPLKKWEIPDWARWVLALIALSSGVTALFLRSRVNK